MNLFNLNNLTIDYNKNPDYFDLTFELLNGNTWSSIGQTLTAQVKPNQTLIFKIKFLPKIVFQGNLFVYLKTQEPISTTIQFSINLKQRIPILSVEPSLFEFRILNGQKKFFEFSFRILEV